MNFYQDIIKVLLVILASLPAVSRYCPEYSSAGVPVEEIFIYDIVPTQYGVGKDIVELLYGKLERAGFVPAMQDRFSKNPLPVLFGPTSKGGLAYYLKDNHHLAVPVSIAHKQEVIPKDSTVCVAIDVDAQHMNWPDFVSSLHTGRFGGRIGYFSPEDRHMLSSLPDAYEKLFSKELHELEDVPARSHVASLLYSKAFQIHGDWFNEYIEFKLGEIVFSEDDDLARPQCKVNAFKRLFGDPKVKAYWMSEFKPTASTEERRLFEIHFAKGAEFCTRLMNSQLDEKEQLELLEYFLNAD